MVFSPFSTWREECSPGRRQGQCRRPGGREPAPGGRSRWPTPWPLDSHDAIAADHRPKTVIDAGVKVFHPGVRRRRNVVPQWVPDKTACSVPEGGRVSDKAKDFQPDAVMSATGATDLRPDFPPPDPVPYSPHLREMFPFELFGSFGET
jgi:hypothetical protein